MEEDIDYNRSVSSAIEEQKIVEPDFNKQAAIDYVDKLWDEHNLIPLEGASISDLVILTEQTILNDIASIKSLIEQSDERDVLLLNIESYCRERSKVYSSINSINLYDTKFTAQGQIKAKRDAAEILNDVCSKITRKVGGKQWTKTT